MAKWEAEGWTTTEPIDIDGTEYAINSYFANNPDMILGKNATTGTQYRENEYTVEPTGDIEVQIAEAIEKLPVDLIENPSVEELDAAARRFDLDPAGKEGLLYIDENNRIFEIAEGVGELVAVRGQDGSKRGLTKAQAQIIRSYIPLRDAVMDVYANQNTTPEALKSAQGKLRMHYRAFTAKNGILNNTKVNERKNKATGEITTFESFPVLDTLKTDPFVYVVAAIEDYNQATNTAEEGLIFSEVIANQEAEVGVTSAADALAVTLNQKGFVDMEYLTELYGVTADEVVDELGEAVFQDPANGSWVTDSEYLSGNVKAKLAVARDAAEENPDFAKNVTALEAVIPEDLPISRIPLNLGPMWMPKDVVQRFAEATIGFSGRINNFIQGDTSAWIVDGEGAIGAYSTGARKSHEILDAALNQATIRVMRYFYVGGKKHSELDKDATAAANQKVQELRDEFGRWVLQDERSVDQISTIYNRQFNTTVPRKFNGDHLTLPRLSARYKLHQWQKNAVCGAFKPGTCTLRMT